jgi:hypothetical protein
MLVRADELKRAKLFLAAGHPFALWKSAVSVRREGPSRSDKHFVSREWQEVVAWENGRRILICNLINRKEKLVSPRAISLILIDLNRSQYMRTM